MNCRLTLAATVLVVCPPALSAPPGDTKAITDCGAVISQPGKYRLANDLLACPEFAITIAASGVSLDLAGNEIRCAREDNRFDIGIEVLDVERVEIRNGRVSNCDSGVDLFGTRHSKVSNMVLHGNLLDPFFGGFGISGFEASNNTIVGNDASGNTTGIELFFGTGNRIMDNIANGNVRAENSPFFPSFGVGIGIAFSNDNEVIDNETSRNSDAGIALANGSTGNVVRDNRANDNDNYGIGAFSREDVGAPLAVGNLIQSNTALGNGRADLLEAKFDPFASPRELVQDTCMNTWKDNVFVSQIAPPDCIQ